MSDKPTSKSKSKSKSKEKETKDKADKKKADKDKKKSKENKDSSSKEPKTKKSSKKETVKSNKSSKSIKEKVTEKSFEHNLSDDMSPRYYDEKNFKPSYSPHSNFNAYQGMSNINVIPKETIGTYRNQMYPSLSREDRIPKLPRTERCDGCYDGEGICFCVNCEKIFCRMCDDQIHFIPSNKIHER